MPENTEYNHQTVRSENKLYNYLKLHNLARENLMRAENSDRVKAAMENRGSSRAQLFRVNDIVAYFRNCTKSHQAWQGPANAIGIDKNIIIVKHGQRTVNANIRDARKFLKDDDKRNAW